MMESAHSPTPNGDALNNMPPTEDFDDPFPSPPLDDLVLSNNEQPQLVGEGQNNKVGASEAESDPWAIMAKAAGEDAHPTAASTAPAAATNNNDASAETAVPAVSASSQGGEPTLTHAEGETFTMPGTEQQQNNNSQSGGSLADQIKGKIQEVDAKTGISTKGTPVFHGGGMYCMLYAPIICLSFLFYLHTHTHTTTLTNTLSYPILNPPQIQSIRNK